VAIHKADPSPNAVVISVEIWEREQLMDGCSPLLYATSIGGDLSVLEVATRVDNTTHLNCYALTADTKNSWAARNPVRKST
jgi:hypothetical protein